MSEEKFSKCKERKKMFECRISGVQKKKEIERKVPGKREVFFALHKKNEVKNFARFAFTGWALG